MSIRKLVRMLGKSLLTMEYEVWPERASNSLIGKTIQVNTAWTCTGWTARSANEPE